MKKISYLFPNFFFIGAQRAAAASIRLLVERGYDVNVLVVDSRGSMREELPVGITVIEFKNSTLFSKIPLLRIFSWPFELHRILSIEKPTVLISICPQTNFTLVLFRIIFGNNPIFIAEEHQHLSNAILNDPKDFKFLWKYLYYFSLNNYWRLDLIRCVSKASALDFIQNWKVPAELICTIYPAFDFDRIRLRSKGFLKVEKVPVICSVGRLTSQKDFSLLIQSFSHVIKFLPAKLVIAGTGPEEENLNRLINHLNLNDHVKLLGFVDYAESVISSSDLFVLTSIWEGFPATLVEAMVLGTPVVSVNCESGPSELIENGVNGFLVNTRDPTLIGRALLHALMNPELLALISKSAKVSVEKYSLESTVSELEDALNILQSRRN